jgi:hypothetical protein
MGIEAEGAADAARAAVASGEDVNVGVADHDGLGGDNGAVCEKARFGDESLQTVRVGLLGVEAVAAVVLEEEAREVEMVADVAGRTDGFVGEDGHKDFGMCGVDGFE